MDWYDEDALNAHYEAGRLPPCPDCGEAEDACRCEPERDEWEDPAYVTGAVHAALEDLPLDQQLAVVEDVLRELREQKTKLREQKTKKGA